jgi:hypothetical protein
MQFYQQETDKTLNTKENPTAHIKSPTQITQTWQPS